MVFILCENDESNNTPATREFARDKMPFGTTAFTLRYYPSLLQKCPMAYAPFLANEFMMTTDSSERRCMLYLALSWRFKGFVGVPQPGSGTFFVIAYFEHLLAAFGATGEQIKCSTHPDAILSALCIDDDHVVDPDVYKECAPFLGDAPAAVPRHVLLYGLCLDRLVPWALRNRIAATTRLARKSDLKKTLPRLGDRFVATNEYKKSQFNIACASRVLGALQVLEDSNTVNADTTDINVDTSIPLYKYEST